MSHGISVLYMFVVMCTDVYLGTGLCAQSDWFERFSSRNICIKMMTQGDLRTKYHQYVRLKIIVSNIVCEVQSQQTSYISIAMHTLWSRDSECPTFSVFAILY